MRDELADKLNAILARNADREAKARLIAEAIRLNGNYRWVGLYDVDPESALVSNIAWSGPAPPAFPTFPITRGLTSRAIADRKTINMGDVASDPAYLTALDSTRSEIIVPVLSPSGSVAGTIDVKSELPNAFDSGPGLTREMRPPARGSLDAHGLEPCVEGFRRLPRLGILPAHIHRVVQMEEKTLPPIQKAQPEEVVVTKSNYWI